MIGALGGSIMFPFSSTASSKMVSIESMKLLMVKVPKKVIYFLICPK